MELMIKEEEKILIVKPLEKNIEALNSREFKTKMIAAIGASHCWVILDLAEVEFLDSNALGSLISLLKLIASRGGQLVICHARASVKRIFTITRLDQAIPLLESEPAAKQLLTNAR